MSTGTPQPLVIDTGGFFARVVEDDANHDRATAVFEQIATGGRMDQSSPAATCWQS